MSRKHHSRSSIAVQSVVNMLKSEGLDPELCLKHTGLNEDQLFNSEADISDVVEVKVIQQALSVLPKRAGYGITAGQALNVNNCGVWGLAILTSPDVRSAFKIASRFSEMSIMLSRVKLIESEAQVSFVLDMSHLPVEVHRFLFERYYVLTLNFLKEMIADYDFSQALLSLPFNDLDYEKELEELTQVRVKSDQDYFGITVNQTLLDLPLKKTDSVIHAHFISECEDLLKQHKELPGFSQRIREYILHNKAFSPKLSEVASAMFMSDRTLRRRLQEEGHSFSEIVLDTKMALAKEWLLTASLPVKVIAVQLDYSEPASFIRAFSKWWGVPPTEIQAGNIPLRYL